MIDLLDIWAQIDVNVISRMRELAFPRTSLEQVKLVRFSDVKRSTINTSTFANDHAQQKITSQDVAKLAE